MTGIDISPAAIASATSREIPSSTFVVGDVVAEIPGRYDIAIDGHCLHCIIGADRARLLANVRAALAPNGTFFVSTMCGEVTGAKLKACFDPVSRCQVVDGIACRYIGDVAEILDELRTAGFEIVRSTRTKTTCGRSSARVRSHARGRGRRPRTRRPRRSTSSRR